MGNTVNERELILEILLAVTRDGEYSHIALNNVLGNYQYLTKVERAFITRVTEGTLERMMEIDYIIHQFSKVRINKMKPVIRTIIRSSVYQIKYMDSVPDSAVCNEAVKLAAKRGFAGLKGFVNGVLRNISRNLDKVEYPDKKDVRTWLSVTYSMPEWILEKWLKEYEVQTVETMLQYFLKETPTWIRCNLSRISREQLVESLAKEDIRSWCHPTIPCALYIEGYDYLEAVECFQKGYFQVQDVSSMAVGEWADPKEGSYVIDVCAAPGGKAVHLADKLQGTGHVEARDLTEYKTALIRENIERSGMNNMEAVCQDATVLTEASVGKADIVIADLPCSGLGVLGKKTDLKYKMLPDMVKSLIGLQREILSVVNQYVKPGGKLLYSTCTVHRGENEDNAEWFAETFPEFELIRQRQSLPGIDGGDGFYIAEFRRKRKTEDG